MGLIIRSSAIHAAGCYTTTAIRKGTRVVEYTGRRISKELADEKYENSPTTYLFGIGDGSLVIDGHGTAMFINHSCDPNCETEEIAGRVWITAIRNISAGEELTYDYYLYDGGEDEAHCNCGAKKCRKSMYSPEELKRRDREIKENAKKKAKEQEKSRQQLPSEATKSSSGKHRKFQDKKSGHKKRKVARR